MTAPFFRIALLFVCISGASLAPGLISGTAMAADTPPSSTSSQTQDFATQVRDLMKAYPDGGPELEARLTQLAQAQGDPAMAAAIMMVALESRPSTGSVTAVSHVLSALSGYTADDLSKAVSEIVSQASDPLDAARGILSVVPLLGTETQRAIGSGLGKAALALEKAGKTSIATVIVAEVSTANIDALRQTFIETAAILVPPDDDTPDENNGGDTTTGTNTGDVPEQPASAS